VLKAFDRQVEINKHLAIRLTQARQGRALLAKEHSAKVHSLEAELLRLSSLLHTRTDAKGNSDRDDLHLTFSPADESRASDSRRSLRKAPQSLPQSQSLTPPRDDCERGLRGAGSPAQDFSPGSRTGDQQRCAVALQAVTAERDSLAMRLHMHARELASLQAKFEIVAKAQDARLDAQIASMEAHTQTMRASLSAMDKDADRQDGRDKSSAALSLLQLQNERSKLSDDVAVLRRRIEWNAAMSNAAADTNAALQAQLGEARAELAERALRAVRDAEDFEKAAAANCALEEQLEALRAQSHGQDSIGTAAARSDVSALEAENMRLKEELLSAARIHEQAQALVRASAAQLRAKHAKDVEQLKARISSLQTALGSAEADCETAAAASLVQEQQIAALREELRDRALVEVETKREDDAALAARGALEAENAQLKEEMCSLRSDLESETRAHEEQVQALDPAIALTRLRAKHAKDVEQLKARISSLQTAVSSAEADRKNAVASDADATAMRSQLQSLAAEMAELKASSSRDSATLVARAEIAEAQLAIFKSGHKRQIAELHTRSESAEAEASQLAAALDEQAARSASAQDAAAQLASVQVEGYRAHVERLTADKSALVAAILAAETRAAIAEEAASSNECAHTKTQAVVLQAGQAIADLEDKLRGAETATADLLERAAKAESALKQGSSREEELREENSARAEELRVALLRLDRSEKEAAALASERDAFVNSSMQNDTADATAEERLANLLAQEEQQMHKLSEQEAANVALQAQLSAARADAAGIAEAARVQQEASETSKREYVGEVSRLKRDAEERHRAWEEKHNQLHDAHETTKREHVREMSRLKQDSDALARELEGMQAAQQAAQVIALKEISDWQSRHKAVSDDLIDSSKNVDLQAQLVLRAQERENALNLRVASLEAKCAEIQEGHAAASEVQLQSAELARLEAEQRRTALEEQLAAQTSAARSADAGKASADARYSEMLQNFQLLERNAALSQDALREAKRLLEDEVRQHQQERDICASLKDDITTLNSNAGRMKREHAEEVERLLAAGQTRERTAADTAKELLEQELQRRDDKHIDIVVELQRQLTAAREADKLAKDAARATATAAEQARVNNDAAALRYEAELATARAAQSEIENTLVLKTDHLKVVVARNQALQEQFTLAQAEGQPQIAQLQQLLIVAKRDAKAHVEELQGQLAAAQAEAAVAVARVEEWAQYNEATVVEYEAALTAKHEEHIAMTVGLQMKLVAAQEAVASMARSHTKGVTQTRTEHETSVQQLAKQLAAQTEQHQDQTLKMVEMQRQLDAAQASAAAASVRIEEWTQYSASTVADYEAALAAKQGESDANHQQWQTAYDAALAEHAEALQHIRLEVVNAKPETHPRVALVSELESATAALEGLSNCESVDNQKLLAMQHQLQEAHSTAEQRALELRVQYEKLLQQSATEVTALAELQAKLRLLAEEHSLAANRHSDHANEHSVFEARYAESHDSHQLVLAELANKWVVDDVAKDCKLCSMDFTTFKRRHHCRKCGEVVCADCSSLTANVMQDGIATKQKVCDACFATLHKTKDIYNAERDYKALFEVQAREQRAADERLAQLIAQQEADLATQHAEAQRRLDNLRAELLADAKRLR